MNDTQSSSVIGSSVTKTDALSLACGACRFTADADLRNPLFVAFAYSPYPFADILSIESGEARAIPGVVDILTYENDPIASIPRRGRGIPNPLRTTADCSRNACCMSVTGLPLWLPKAGKPPKRPHGS